MDITMPQTGRDRGGERIVATASGSPHRDGVVGASGKTLWRRCNGARVISSEAGEAGVLYEVIKYVLGDDGAVANAAGAGV